MLVRLALLSLLLPGAAFGAEKLGADGFPADWTPEDFQMANASPTVVSSAVPQPASGSAVYRIDELPKVKSDIIPPVAKVKVEQSPTAPEVALPKVEAEDTGAMPKTLKDLNAYGPLSTPMSDDIKWSVPLLGGSQGGFGAMLNAAQGRKSGALWTLNDVYRRVLLSRAPVPVVAQPSPTMVSGTVVTPTVVVAPTEPWLAVRAKALEGLGFYEAADGLWRAIYPDARLSHPALAEGWVASRLLAGQTGEACQLAGNQVLNSGGSDAGNFWRQAVLACQAIGGQRRALGLSLQLVEGKGDPFLIAVADAVREDRAIEEKVKVPPLIGPLPAAILATYPALINEEWLPRLPDVVWRRLVRTEGLPWRLRTAAAELLAAQTHSASDVEIVQAFYAVADVKDVDWLDPLGSGDKIWKAGEPVRARAVLWLGANGRAGEMGLRALCWQRWAMRVNVAGLGSLMAPMSPDLARIKPGPALAWLAPLAQSLTWQRGDFDDNDWLTALQQNASVAPELKIEAEWLAVQAGLLSGNIEKPVWHVWLQQTAWTADQRLRAARLLSAATAVDMPLPPEFLPMLQQKVGEFDESVGGARPLWAKTVDTAVFARQAGTALDMLRQLAPGEDPLSPPILTQEVNTLHDLGLENEARQLTAAALMPPLVNEQAIPPAPKIEAGTKPLEKGKKVSGPATIKLAPPKP